MNNEEPFQERVARVQWPTSRYSLLGAPDGRFLGTGDKENLETFHYVDDNAVWEQLGGKGDYRHVTTGLTVTAEPAARGCHLRLGGKAVAADGTLPADAAVFVPEHGPAQLPSEYSGPEADLIEAPAGSVILYDARTWHRTIIAAGGTIETSKLFIPLLRDSVKAVVLPGSSIDDVEMEKLKLFRFLKNVRIEDVSMSGRFQGEPWAIEGSFEFDGAPPPIRDVARHFVALQMRANQKAAAAKTSLKQ